MNVRVKVLLIALLAVTTSGVAAYSEEAAAPPRPTVLMPVIGPTPKGGTEGSTEADSDQSGAGYSGEEFAPGGGHDEAVGEREQELTEQGFTVEKRYFSSLQALLCWLREQALANVERDAPHLYRHVEIFGHGNQAGPSMGWIAPDGGGEPAEGEPAEGDGDSGGGKLTADEEANRWRNLGKLLGRLMEEGKDKNGHILLGWCHSTGAVPVASGEPNELPGGLLPGGLVAGSSGKPTYGCPGEIGFPRIPGDARGEPNSQPQPPPRSSGPSGWERFPPEVFPLKEGDDGEEEEDPTGDPIPNDGTRDPKPVPMTDMPTATDPGNRLPHGERPGHEDPHANDPDAPPPEPPAPDEVKDNDRKPLVPESGESDGSGSGGTAPDPDGSGSGDSNPGSGGDPEPDPNGGDAGSGGGPPPIPSAEDLGC